MPLGIGRYGPCHHRTLSQKDADPAASAVVLLRFTVGNRPERDGYSWRNATAGLTDRSAGGYAARQQRDADQQQQRPDDRRRVERRHTDELRLQDPVRRKPAHQLPINSR
jgi:hypothetical protein